MRAVLAPLPAALALVASVPDAQCAAGCCTAAQTFPLAGQSPAIDAGDELGLAADAVGNVLAVGAPGFEDGAGAVFVYVLDGSWSLDGVLRPDAAAGAGRFGATVAIGRSRVVVGAPQSDDPAIGPGAGKVYVFRRDPGRWVLEQELPPDVPGVSDHGADVAISGGTVLVGGIGEEAAYFWRYAPGSCPPEVWCLEDKILSPAGMAGICYGEAVAIDGDDAVVGASEFHLGVNAGAVFHYRRTGTDWAPFEEPLLNPEVLGPGEHYGETLALAGGWLLVAEPRGGGGGDGIVHAYARNPDGTFGPGAAYEQILDDGPGTTIFGRSLALRGRSALVGAPFTQVGAAGFAGTAYRFDLSGGSWTLAQAYVPCSGLEDFDAFGRSVALGDFVFVGAHHDQDLGTDAGRVYAFELP